MSKIIMKDLTYGPVPFFGRYLEGQDEQELTPEEMSKVVGGRRMVTRKYPSDHESPGRGKVTRKFPSDHESCGYQRLGFRF